MQDPRNRNSRIRLGTTLLLAVAAIGLGVGVARRDMVSATLPAEPAVGVEENGRRTSAARESAFRHDRPSARSSRPASNPAPLPVIGTPLAQIYDLLEVRAEAGDEAATRRLFHEVHRCKVVREEQRLLAEITPVVATNPNPGDTSIGIVRGSRVDMKLVRDVTNFVQENSTRCEGVSVEQLESITPLTLRMAQLGDLKAIDCYIGSEFARMEGLLDHPEWVEQYRTQVPALVQSALRRGDWVAVELLRQAYSGASEAAPLGQLLGSDPASAYRLLRLQRLGATGSFVDELEPRLAAAARELSSSQIAEADAWASDYHTRHFTSASNEAFDGSDICEFADD